MHAWMIIVILGFLLALTLFASYRLYKAQKEAIDILKGQVASQRENVNILLDYVERIKKIKAGTAQTIQEIQNAESDEEVQAIINGIIADNNNRVRNSSED